MNRAEALRILGLDEQATAADIKAAYRETAQILHPDRFASNKKLQERATEQFKRLQEAYEVLASGKASRAAAAPSPGTYQGQTAARLAGIAAARTQLVAQRDHAYDERRNAVSMAAIGGIIALLTMRRVAGILGLVAALASAATIWGIVQGVSAQRSISTLDQHIKQLNDEERTLLAQQEEE